METTNSITTENIEAALCRQFCAEFKITKKKDQLYRIDTPFYFPDGDSYQIYLTALKMGGFRVSDMGHTLMHLSYENDIEVFRKGTRGSLLEQIKLEFDLMEEDGEFFLESTLEGVPENVFKLGQSITKIYDLTFLNRYRVESTFYEDLKERIFNIVPEDKIIVDFVAEQMESAADYPIDYKIEGKNVPLFLFGVANRDKARLTTIVLERLIRHEIDFESLLVFQDFDNIPKADSKRLMNIAGEMISSLDAKEDFKRKVLKRVA